MGDEETNDDERPALRRTWPQRLLITGVAFAAVGSLIAAGLVWFAQQRLEERRLVTLDKTTEVAPAGAAADRSSSDDGDGAAEGARGDAADGPDPTADPNTPVETFPLAEPGARNILITGADNNACLDPDSRFAPAFGDRQGAGERSDTIMMWRVNPTTRQVAILSFPRDLWLKIDGRSSKGRINEAYQRDDPQRLINTIQQNFGIETDHFVQVDFCAFKELVDAVDGVAVPFETPVRDGATGLAVPEAGCFTFSGEHALAYVRSRKMEFQTEDGRWERDGTSDLGRISRQQDFIRRVGDELLSNAFSPDVVRTLFDVSRDYIVTDDELTLDRILEFSGVLQRSDPANITTYQIEARGTTIQGNSVLEPRLGGDNMQAVLQLFRGEVTLAERPEQIIDLVTGESDDTTAPVTTVPLIDPDTTTTTTTTAAEDVSSTEPVPFETVPVVETEDIVYGVVPDSAISCT
jgi:LCP family protein required for cell wall assembly